MSNVEDGGRLPPPRSPPAVLCSTSPVFAHPSDQPPTDPLSTLKAALGSEEQMKVLEEKENPGEDEGAGPCADMCGASAAPGVLLGLEKQTYSLEISLNKFIRKENEVNKDTRPPKRPSCC